MTVVPTSIIDSRTETTFISVTTISTSVTTTAGTKIGTTGIGITMTGITVIGMVGFMVEDTGDDIGGIDIRS